MTETLTRPPELEELDPAETQEVSLAAPESQLHVRFTSFEDARTAEKKFSDEFIDDCLDYTHKIGEQTMSTKGYLDKVETTPTDEGIIEDPESIAAVYLATTDMVARNLKLLVKSDTPTERKHEIKAKKEAFLADLRTETQQAADDIVAWSEGKINRFPVAATEYRGLEVDGIDPLDAGTKDADEYRSNLKIQRQIGGTFIMGYSDKRAAEKLHDKDDNATQRIYLNPDIMATPQIFEKILAGANKAGLSLQLKMLQRAPELAEAHMRRTKGERFDALRGDGIVIYADNESADEVLSLALAVAQDHPEAFRGRETSRIPQRITDGIAVGDEPGIKGKSLTIHREEIIGYVADRVRKSGKTGQEAREAFRRGMHVTLEANGVDGNNLAFNRSDAA
jgi:hypothetical protein